MRLRTPASLGLHSGWGIGIVCGSRYIGSLQCSEERENDGQGEGLPWSDVLGVQVYNSIMVSAFGNGMLTLLPVFRLIISRDRLI